MKITNKEIQDTFQVSEDIAQQAIAILAGVDCEGQAMADLDSLLGGFGVEPIRDPRDSSECIAEYINTGDTYSGTILRDIETGEFLLTSYGDWLEAWEQKVCAESHLISCGYCGHFTPHDRVEWSDVRCESCGRNVQTGEPQAERKPHGYARIKLLHRYLERGLFYRKHGISYARMLRGVELLAKLVHDYDADSEELWNIGEYSSTDLGNMLSGSYWFFVHHSGNEFSDEYRIHSAIGRVYDPGPIEKMPERDSSAMDIYKAWKRRAKSARR